jgi:phenylalanyl-tRNA synthetase beta chain
MQRWQLKGPILLAELDWQRIIEAKLPKLEPLSKYPEVKRDIALLVDQDISYGQLEAAIWQIATPLLKKIQIFDIYQGYRIGQGNKSLALRLYFQHQDRTLVDKEINHMTQTITDELVSRFDATLRGSANGSNES